MRILTGMSDTSWSEAHVSKVDVSFDSPLAVPLAADRFLKFGTSKAW
jgi:hypothetical protein